MTTPILVRDLMTVGVPTCKCSTPVLDVGRYLLEHHLEEMVVLNEEGEGVGVCGYAELVPLYGREDLAALTAETVMREGVPELPADIPLAVAATMLRDRGLRVAYMTHNSAGIIYPAAYISYWHILRCLTAYDESALKDLGISAERQSPLDVFIQRRDAARRKAGLH
ncbi:MAG TPA: CBS domain-containing protein [Anaerolineaceae bacterium]|jgi:CBS domain-containing protein